MAIIISKIKNEYNERPFQLGARSGWKQYKRVHDFEKLDDPNTQNIIIHFLPSLCFMINN
ncbi:MAG: hypothetical protein JW925_13890 [Syntrophaceae bacterium]|nr:hypothetical protein [Syntrophaceae bacterium]